MNPLLLEIIGYTGSLLIAVSLMMSKILRLRLINFFGAAVFAVYGALLSPAAVPVVILNGFIALTDLYFLLRMRRRRDLFDTIECRPDDGLLLRFISHYGADIRRYFPKFTAPLPTGSRTVFVLRNLLPVGLFAFHKDRKNAQIGILVDYVIPDYRDMKNARFLYETALTAFSDKPGRIPEGFSKFVVHDISPRFIPYLTALGFAEEKKGVFTKQIGQ
jgi:hypothetical protein